MHIDQARVVRALVVDPHARGERLAGLAGNKRRRLETAVFIASATEVAKYIAVSAKAGRDRPAGADDQRDQSKAQLHAVPFISLNPAPPEHSIHDSAIIHDELPSCQRQLLGLALWLQPLPQQGVRPDLVWSRFFPLPSWFSRP